MPDRYELPPTTTPTPSLGMSNEEMLSALDDVDEVTAPAEQEAPAPEISDEMIRTAHVAFWGASPMRSNADAMKRALTAVYPLIAAAALASCEAEDARRHAFVDWLITLDDPPGSPGAEERRTVTLTQIINRALAARAMWGAGLPDEEVDSPA
jgi:hypothetical protein